MPDETFQKNPPIPDASASMNAQIFTMPEAYRYGKEVKLVEPKTVQKPFMAPATPVPVQPLPATPSSPSKKKTTSATSKALLISGGIVFVAIAIGGFLVWRSGVTQPVTPVVQETPTLQPEPRPVEPTAVTPTPTPVTPTPSVQSPFAIVLSSGKDSDSDGLTDVEEQRVYKTNPTLPDTDSDGFLDGNEVFHLYNPSGIAPGTLLEAKLAQSYTTTDGVEMLYPTLWTVDPVISLDTSLSTSSILTSVRFRATTGESFLVSEYGVLTPETQQALLLEWITKQGGQEQVVKTKTKSGNDSYVTRDQLKSFVSFKNQPVLFQYEPGVVGTVEYLQTFQMMMNSLKMK